MILVRWWHNTVRGWGWLWHYDDDDDDDDDDDEDDDEDEDEEEEEEEEEAFRSSILPFVVLPCSRASSGCRAFDAVRQSLNFGGIGKAATEAISMEDESFQIPSASFFWPFLLRLRLNIRSSSQFLMAHPKKVQKRHKYMAPKKSGAL